MLVHCVRCYTSVNRKHASASGTFPVGVNLALAVLAVCVHACLSVCLQSPTLQELYLSQTGLSGRLPDVVPRNSSLKALFAIGLFDNQRPDPTNDGITGVLVAQCVVVR